MTNTNGLSITNRHENNHIFVEKSKFEEPAAATANLFFDHATDTSNPVTRVDDLFTLAKHKTLLVMEEFTAQDIKAPTHLA